MGGPVPPISLTEWVADRAGVDLASEYPLLDPHVRFKLGYWLSRASAAQASIAAAYAHYASSGVRSYADFSIPDVRHHRAVEARAVRQLAYWARKAWNDDPSFPKDDWIYG